MVKDFVAYLMAQQEHQLIDREVLGPAWVDLDLATAVDACSGHAVVKDQGALEKDDCPEGMLQNDLRLGLADLELELFEFRGR